MQILINPLNLSSESDGGFQWRSTSVDPQLTVAGAKSLAGHWVRLQVSIKTELQVITPTVIYENNGKGFSEASAHYLFADRNGDIDFSWRLSPDLIDLRVDPVALAIKFSIDGFSIKKTSRAAILYRSLQRVLAGRPGNTAKKFADALRVVRAIGLRATLRRIVAVSNEISRKPATQHNATPDGLARHRQEHPKRLNSLEQYVKNGFDRSASKVHKKPTYAAKSIKAIAPSDIPLKLVAFYLPQFHPFAENDLWWGKGFTEWTNVSKAQPQYLGHYQPRLPGELGFYDLRLTEVMRQQIDLAHHYGLTGFCFHHYWFGGTRLMERPVNQLLADSSLKIDFCLCWANENWTRRWDGAETDVLIAQKHSPEDDIAFFHDILPALKDVRYIKVDGKPFLIVYRIDLLPEPASTVKRWRECARQAGLEGLYLVAARTYQIGDPTVHGFDAMVEFPPHQVHGLDVTHTKTIINPEFSGKVCDFKDFSERYAAIEESGFVNYKTVMPSWDNEARKPGKGYIFDGATPDLYAKWLDSAIQIAAKNRQSEQFVFINAWNEWAEGAYLEPDRHWGYAYLQATADVLKTAAQRVRGTSVAVHSSTAALVHNTSEKLSKTGSQLENTELSAINLNKVIGGKPVSIEDAAPVQVISPAPSKNIGLTSTASGRVVLSKLARRIWSALPMSDVQKQAYKNHCFEKFPQLFGRLGFYHAWTNARQVALQDSLRPVCEPVDLLQPVYVSKLSAQPLASKPVKVICFYLPQFHAIRENDEWWGKGFTEWTNVRPAQAQFVGHYQPHVPDELGYYNLLDKSVQHKQIELAKLYGIEGFCFYFYWFAGHTLLETPVRSFLEDKTLELPFCLCWANENWSRRWDGLDKNILIEQKHSDEDDINFIRYISEYLKDGRYIKIDGKPLLVVYRPSLLPSPTETVKRWREWCSSNGVGEIFIAYTQSFEAVNPEDYGFDAAIEFPPNNSAPPLITDTVQPLASDFNSTVYDWSALAERSKQYKQVPYKLFRGVCPSWDNTARRKNNSTVFLNSTPEKYEQWLKNAISDTEANESNADKRLVFVNAWNEWAEGAHLEPDSRYGYAWLQATRNALEIRSVERQILLVTHDCLPHGAQFLTLEIGRQLARNGYAVAILALGDGGLYSEFAELGPCLKYEADNSSELESYLSGLRLAGYSQVITSTVVSGCVLPQLVAHGFNALCLIHELPGIITSMKQEANAKLVSTLAHKVVFPAEVVKDGYCNISPTQINKIVIRQQGLLRSNPFKGRNEKARMLLCKRFDLPENTHFVLAIGYLDHRKGPDLFVEIAGLALAKSSNTAFIWVGHGDSVMPPLVQARAIALGLGKRFILAGFDASPFVYYAGASVYALTSREDPFPNVVLEAAAVNVPVVAFQGITGAESFILRNGGRTAVSFDIADFADQIAFLLSHNKSPSTSHFSVELSFPRYVLDLMYQLNGSPRVSVVVPNYNYGHLIERRLDSIRSQTYPVYELIILDDNSSDDSVSRIEAYCKFHALEYQLVVNSENSGSVFRQWVMGCQIATGDVVWIAEADDSCSKDFLSKIVPSFVNSEVVISYSQSQQMDMLGAITDDSYLAYTGSVSQRWTQSFCVDGFVEIRDGLSVKNTIPNVSAALMLRSALLDTFTELGEKLYEFKVAGDWLVYLHLLKKGGANFCAESLNQHCRHQGSVTSALQLQRHLAEVVEVQKQAAALVELPDAIALNASDYVELLRKQFGLVTLPSALLASDA